MIIDTDIKQQGHSPKKALPVVVTGLRKTKTEMVAASTPLAFPSTWSVRGLVNLVTRKLHDD